VKKAKKLIEVIPAVSSILAVALVGAFSCGAIALIMRQVRRNVANPNRETLLVK